MAMDVLHFALLDGKSNFQIRGQPKKEFSHFTSMQVPLALLSNINKIRSWTWRLNNCHVITILLKTGIMCATHVLLKARYGKMNIDVTSFSLTFIFHRILQTANHSAYSHIILKTNI